MQHSFEVEDAVKYGIEKAIILNNLRFWLEKNRANRKNISDGQVWTYNSAEAFELLFPYMKARTIARYLRELEFDGVIISGVNSDNKLDRTKWYSTPDYSITKCDIPLSQNGKSAESEFAYSNLTICDNVTDINKQIVNTDINNKDLKYLSVSTKHDETVKNIFAVWCEKMNSPRSRLDANRKRLITNALKKYTELDLVTAITGCAMSPFHMGANADSKKYNGLDLILRNAEKIEQFIGFCTNPPVQRQQQAGYDFNDTSWTDDFGDAY